MEHTFIPVPDPFYPTSEELVERKLDLLQLKDGDVVVDLGCGDARALIAACQRADVTCMGYETLDDVYAEAQQKVADAGLSDRIVLHQQDYHNADLSQASALILYLSRNLLGVISRKLENELAAGARIVTHQFDVPAWRIEEKRTVKLSNGSSETIFLHVKQKPDNQVIR